MCLPLQLGGGAGAGTRWYEGVANLGSHLQTTPGRERLSETFGMGTIEICWSLRHVSNTSLVSETGVSGRRLCGWGCCCFLSFGCFLDAHPSAALRVHHATRLVVTPQRFTGTASECHVDPANAKYIVVSSEMRGPFYCLGFRNKTLRVPCLYFLISSDKG